MAKQQKVRKAVSLVSPGGSKVTVAEESAEKYKARGYKEQNAPRRTVSAEK